MTPLFVELCAGTAALSLRLQGGRNARPPVSRMGAKTGYADVILAVLGLRPGEGAEHYLWCEPDDGARLMLIAYTDPELRRTAASIIRGWASEEPRALWTRLRDEGPVNGGPPTWPGPTPPYGHEVARNALLGAWAFRQGESRSGYVGSAAHGPAGGRPLHDEIAARLDDAPTMPATILPGAVDPREVARHAWVACRTMPQAQACGATAGDYLPPVAPAGNRRWSPDSPHLDAMPAMPATILPAATEPPTLPPGTIAYMDPPYVNTTGYANDLPRSEVVRLARAWHEAGASVIVSEAEPIPDLVGDGWHAVEITGGRVGQKRTFSRQQREWLTMSRAPVWRPSEQAGLFG